MTGARQKNFDGHQRVPRRAIGGSAKSERLWNIDQSRRLTEMCRCINAGRLTTAECLVLPEQDVVGSSQSTGHLSPHPASLLCAWLRYCKTATTTEASVRAAPIMLTTMVIESVLSDGDAELAEADATRFTLAAGVTVPKPMVVGIDIFCVVAKQLEKNDMRCVERK